jgi:hypothetical protein
MQFTCKFHNSIAARTLLKLLRLTSKSIVVYDISLRCDSALNVLDSHANVTNIAAADLVHDFLTMMLSAEPPKPRWGNTGQL